MNSSDSGLGLFEYLDQTAYSVATLIVCVVAIVTNLFLIIVLLSIPKLRKSPKHFLILNVCLVCVIDGAFPTALFTELYFRNEWTHSCGALTAAEIISDILPSIKALLVVAICVTFVLGCLHPRSSEGSFLYIFAVVMAIVCWLGSCVVLIPLFVKGLHDPSGCVFLIKKSFLVPIYIVIFLPQAFLVFISIIINIVVYFVKFGNQSFIANNTSFPFDTVFAGVIVILFRLPWPIFQLVLIGSSDVDHRLKHIAQRVTVFFSMASCAVIPFAWLLCRQVRKGICQLIRCQCGEKTSRSEEYILEDHDN